VDQRNIVIIGGDAAGMSAAGKIRRTEPDARVTVLEKGEWVSYSACGLPFYLQGVVPEIGDLVARTADEHRANGIDLRTRHEAVGIDIRKRVVVATTDDGEQAFPYDKLLIATGARARRLDFAQTDLDGVAVLRSIPDALAIRAHIDRHRPRHCVLVGGGYIGIEMAEAMRALDLDVTLVDHGPAILKILDPEMSTLVASCLTSNGVTLQYDRSVIALRGTGIVQDVLFADSSWLPADMVVVGVGVEPNAEIARDAGIALGASGAIRVDSAQRTSQFHVYAAGDCAEARHLVLGHDVHIPLGTTANKQGRVAGSNMLGGSATFGGIVGTMVCKVFDSAFARTGLTQNQAGRAGLRARSVQVEVSSRAGYYNDPPTIHARMTVEEGTDRLLGAQLYGDDTVAKRIDVAATALHARMTVEDFTHLDLSYTPPFSPVFDPLMVAANVALR
jgi:NADPH-dependent 2,4-dienoyl-CoA reductase/sulfur reductase-like enzyme